MFKNILLLALALIIAISCGKGSGSPIDPSPVDTGLVRFISGIRTSCSEDVAVMGNYLYIADGTSGLKVADISNESAPEIVKTIPTTYAYRIAIRDNHLYLCDGPAGIKVYSLDVPSSPHLTFNEDTEWATSVAFQKNMLFVGDYFGGLRIYDRNHPAYPSLVKIVRVSRVRDIAFSGDTLLVSDAPFGLATYFFKGPASPICTYTDSTRFGNFEDIVSYNGYAFIAQNDESSRLSVFNVSRLSNIRDSGDYRPARFIDGLTGHDYHIVAACGEEGIVGYDASGAPKLRQVFKFDTPGYARRARIEGDRLFVADMSGVMIYRLGVSGGTFPPPFKHQAHDVPQGSLPGYENQSLLFGDVHVHTNISDGDESPDFTLLFARDVAQLDFCVLTDHSNLIVNDNYQGLAYYQSMPDKYDEPGNFSVLYGYEWSSLLSGHRNIYTLDNTIPVLSHQDPMYDEIFEFWDALQGYDYISICHHPMIRSQFNWWKYKNQEIEPDVEFYSKWGLSLREDNERPIINNNYANGIFRAMIGEGTRYGFVAGSDTHLSRPGAVLQESRQDGSLPYPEPGITAVWADSFTREGVYNALKNRHCYGTTGTKVNIEFSVNGAIMGSEITASSPPTVEFKVSSDVDISVVSLFRISSNGVSNYRTYDVNAKEFSGSDVPETFVGGEGYALKAYLSNGDFAMCSPVWVDRS